MAGLRRTQTCGELDRSSLGTEVTLMGWVWVTALALVSTTLAFVTLFAGLKRIDPANASIIYTLDPVIAVALAAIVLQETLSASKILGGVLILVAVVLVARSEGEPVVR